MNDEILDPTSAKQVEQALRDMLASGDVAIATTRPILRHLLANRDHFLFSDEVIARVRGMIGHIAWQLLFARAQADDIADPGEFAESHQPELMQLLSDDVAFLAHAHALTLELQLAEQMQRRSGIDCVLSPLLQEQAASSDTQLATSAMRVLAAQARFIQQQRRMEMPLSELSGDLFHKALLLMRTQAGDSQAAEDAEHRLWAEYDESLSRIGQITRLVMGLGRGASKALSINHSGLAIFSTALAMASGQDRNLAILSFGENQLVRLAVTLRAAGLKHHSVAEQFVYIHPDRELPDGLDQLSADQAAEMLADSQAQGLG